MALNDLLGKILLIGSLAVGSAYCGNGEGGNPCRSDADCKGERICVAGTCSGGDDGGNDGDRCGNSPFYGKHLWEITMCFGAWYMRNDCFVGESSGGGGYVFDADEDGNHITTTYNGLEMTTTYSPPLRNKVKTIFTFDPTIRFVNSPDNDAQITDINKLNRILDENGGAVVRKTEKFYADGTTRLKDECSSTKAQRCTYVTLDTPFPGKVPCQDSAFFVGTVRF